MDPITLMVVLGIGVMIGAGFKSAVAEIKAEVAKIVAKVEGKL